MVNNQAKLPYLDIKINKKIWMDIYNEPTNSKRYLPFTSNYPFNWQCSTNIPLSLSRRICTFVENETVKEKRFKELKKAILEQKYRRSLIEASTLKAKEIPLKVLTQPKTAKHGEVIPFMQSSNPNIKHLRVKYHKQVTYKI